jgi:general secretion pathway protein N
MRLHHWVLLALVFLATLAMRLPAGWVLALLPAGASCTNPSGTLWNGQCAQLVVAGHALKEVGWSLEFWPLLTATVRAELRVDDDALRGHARVRRGPGGTLEISDTQLHLRADGSLLTLVPPGWAGEADANISHGLYDAGVLRAVTGHIEVTDLAQRDPPLRLGNYALDLVETPGLAVSGQLHDLGGPLAVTATLRSTDGREFALDGQVGSRDDADPALQRALDALGPADAGGRRSFSVAGSM